MKNKKAKNWFYIMWMMVFIILLIISMFFLFTAESTGQKECKRDCPSLDMGFFKYDSGGFGSSECWCKDENNEVRQVW